MSRDQWDRKANKLVKRDWQSVCELWLTCGIVAGVPGTPPQCAVGELPSLQQELLGIKGDEPKDVAEDIEGLRQGVLKEGIFQLQKSAHILNGAQIHIERGMPSWSLSSAYHSAFCAANGILNLLGVAFADVDGRNFLIDVWSQSSRGGRFKLEASNQIRLQKTPGLPAQRNIWQVFQRMLRITNFNNHIIRDNWRNAFLGLGKTDFSRKRNDVYYRSSSWPYDDVREFITANDFGFDCMSVLDGSVISDAEENGFPLGLAFISVRIGHQMLKSLAGMSRLLKPELDVFCVWLSGDKNTLYQNAFANST